jgi:excisionase family DNA binding protein
VATIQNLDTHDAAHVTVSELAEYWGIAERTVQYWCAMGAMKATHVGRQWRIKTEDARAYGRPADIITSSITGVCAGE